jgi:hypothetical protein
LSATLNRLPVLVGLQEARELAMRTAIPSSAMRRRRMVEIGVSLVVHRMRRRRVVEIRVMLMVH